MLLSSPSLFGQLLPQASETHTEMLENWMQTQKENLTINTIAIELPWMCQALGQFCVFLRVRINRDQTGSRSIL